MSKCDHVWTSVRWQHNDGVRVCCKCETVERKENKEKK